MLVLQGPGGSASWFWPQVSTSTLNYRFKIICSYIVFILFLTYEKIKVKIYILSCFIVQPHKGF